MYIQNLRIMVKIVKLVCSNPSYIYLKPKQSMKFTSSKCRSNPSYVYLKPKLKEISEEKERVLTPHMYIQNNTNYYHCLPVELF